MLLERIYHEKLAQAAYLLVCEKTRTALVVDPHRDIQQYTDAARQHNARIAAVAETHIHADFVSGSWLLAREAGATLYVSGAGTPEWQYGFAGEPGVELLTGGSRFHVGTIGVEALHTPGHTPEHMTFLIADLATAQVPLGALTGDFIFVGDVGRPDLLERAAGVRGTMHDSARALFRSLREFATQSDYLQLWPGHGAGSACGKSLGAMPQTTLGYERLFNWAFAETDENAFVEKILSGQPSAPAYFAAMKRVNREGPRNLPVLSVPQIDGGTFAGLLKSTAPNRFIVDTRLEPAYAREHVRGTINVPYNKSFLTWMGHIVPPDAQLVLIAEDARARTPAIARDLALIGFDSLEGVFEASGIAGLHAAGVAISQLAAIGVEELRARRERSGITLIDVRNESEWQAGHIPGALHFPLATLRERVHAIPDGGPVALYCGSGGRAQIAASILEASGRPDVHNVTGGYGEWVRSGYDTTRE